MLFNTAFAASGPFSYRVAPTKGLVGQLTRKQNHIVICPSHVTSHRHTYRTDIHIFTRFYAASTEKHFLYASVSESPRVDSKEVSGLCQRVLQAASFTQDI